MIRHEMVDPTDRSMRHARQAAPPASGVLSGARPWWPDRRSRRWTAGGRWRPRGARPQRSTMPGGTDPQDSAPSDDRSLVPRPPRRRTPRRRQSPARDPRPRATWPRNEPRDADHSVHAVAKSTSPRRLGIGPRGGTDRAASRHARAGRMARRSPCGAWTSTRSKSSSGSPWWDANTAASPDPGSSSAGATRATTRWRTGRIC